MKPNIQTKEPNSGIYDLVIIGAGPAGLASAIYGAADGLKTLLLSKEPPGGQCGRSSCVENYLGFPDGISGQELADRGAAQARKFGCEIRIPVDVTSILKHENYFIILSPTGLHNVRAKTVVVATGLQLRKLGLKNEERCTNVHYYAQMSQGKRFAGKEIHIIGGANSAAQAAMYFSEWAIVNLVVRRSNLSDSMSGYLEGRLRAHPNVKLIFNAEVTAIHGEKRCKKVTLTLKNGALETHVIRPTAALLVYAGAVPQTVFVPGWQNSFGYIKTGEAIHHAIWDSNNLQRPPFSLESSTPGLFVIGDVRKNSPKGITAGVGEGATAVKQIHEYLNTL